MGVRVRVEENIRLWWSWARSGGQRSGILLGGDGFGVAACKTWLVIFLSKRKF